MDVRVGNDYVAIYPYPSCPEDDEIVRWVDDEWKEDPELVPTIVNAVQLALSKPEEFWRRMLFNARDTPAYRRLFALRRRWLLWLLEER